MSNEMDSLPILYKHLKLPLFSFTKVKIIKLAQCGPCSINGQQFPKKSKFETLYIVIEHLVLVTF
jgi:hypothetical protein